LLYFAAIIVTAMVSMSLGSYGSAPFFDDSTTWSKVLTITVVLLVAVVNIAGAKFVDRVQSLIVIVLLAVFGAVTVDEVVADGETALAEAAKPALGQAGFAMMAVAALLAETGTFPPVFGRTARAGGTRVLVISVVLVLLLASRGCERAALWSSALLDLTAVASLGGGVAQVIFLVVSVAAFKPRRETGSTTVSLVVAIVLTVVVLLVFTVQTLRNEPETFFAIIGILVLAVDPDLVWARMRAGRATSGH
jgi:hypothetical protein